jgi:hypothetical protein
VATAAANVIPPLTMGLPWDAGGFAGTSATAAPAPAVTHAGSPAIVLTGEGAYYGQTTSPRVAVEDTRTYQVSAWVKTDAITEFVEVDVFWYSATGEQYRAWGEAVGGQLQGTRDWTRLQGTVTPPPGAVRAVVQVRAKSSGGKAWVSDLQMVPRATAPPSPPRASTPTPTSPDPAPTLAQLLERFTALEQQYRQQQEQIAATYHAVLTQALQQPSPDALQQARHAYERATAQLEAAYLGAKATWAQLYADWQALMQPRTAQAHPTAPPTSQP